MSRVERKLLHGSLRTKMANDVQLSAAKPLKLKHIPELDGLRGVAALAVFFHHLAYASIHSSPWGPAIYSLYKVSRWGLYGVDLFFVLSGYLITSLLLEDRESANYWHNFYWKRALRILPVYFVSLLAVWIWIPGTTGGVILSIFFLANFTNVFHVNIGGPYWTLAIEEQFYLIWPQFVRRMGVDRLQKLALAIVLIEPALRLIDTGFHHFNFILTFFRCDGLAIGAFLACQCHRKQLAEQKFTAPLWRRFPAVWLLLGSLILVVATARMIDSARFPMQGAALFLSAINLCFYSLIRIAVQGSGSKSMAVFRSSVLVFFGRISYCMYMSHTYVARIYDHWRGPLQAGNTFEYFTRIAVVLSATVVICLVSRYALELPFMSLRKYVLRKSVPVAAAKICL